MERLIPLWAVLGVALMLWVLRDDQMKEMSEARIGIGLDRRGPGIPKGFAVYERFESAALLPLEDV
jgi:hypothetical protein